MQKQCSTLSVIFQLHVQKHNHYDVSYFQVQYPADHPQTIHVLHVKDMCYASVAYSQCQRTGPTQWPQRVSLYRNVS